MKNILLTISLIVLSISSFGQSIVTPVGGSTPQFQQVSSSTTMYHVNGMLYPHVGFVLSRYVDTVSANNNPYIKWWPGAKIVTGNTEWLRDSTGQRWIAGGSGGSDSSFNGNRPITRDFSTVTGVNLATTTIATTLDALLYPSQPPTSALTATYSATTATAFSLELMSAGAALSVTLNWTGGRQASTGTIATINVDGVNQSFSQPAAPGSVSGTKATTVIRNTNTSFTDLVTTTDSKAASSVVSFSFFPKRYTGYTTTNPPSSADIVTAAGGAGELTTSKSKSTFSIVVTGSSKYVFYAYPSSYGALSSIIISGIESIGAFTSSTVSVTNASGYVQNYLVYTSNNVFSSVTVNFNSAN